MHLVGLEKQIAQFAHDVAVFELQLWVLAGIAAGHAGVVEDAGMEHVLAAVPGGAPGVGAVPRDRFFVAHEHAAGEAEARAVDRPGQSGGTGGRGQILGGAVEFSTVDIAREFTNLIVLQRGYQANARVVTAVDEISQETINLKR